jgi:hypothetical protein
MRRHTLILLGLACCAPGLYESANAGTTLTFDSSSYTVRGGQTVQVEVFLSQTSGGTPISPSNALLTAAVDVSFNNPSGIAAVLSTSNITGGPLFDASVPGLNPTQFQASVADTSLLGIGTLPVLLGTFTFTGLKAGTTQISVAAHQPGPSFSTTQGAISDPTPATANINVLPEPSSLMIVLTGGPLLVGGLALRRRFPWRSQAA